MIFFFNFKKTQFQFAHNYFISKIVTNYNFGILFNETITEFVNFLVNSTTTEVFVFNFFREESI